MDESKRTITQADAVYLIHAFEKYFATKLDVSDLKSEFTHLPTKDEFFKSQDKLTVRLKKIDENTEVQSGQVNDHEQRLQKVEQKLGITPA